MGSVVSYLFGSVSATDDDDDENDAAAAGGNDDVPTTIRSLLLQVPASAEERTPQRWQAIVRRIEDHPEEAAVFCHGQESSRECNWIGVSVCGLPPSQVGINVWFEHIYIVSDLVPFSCRNTYFMRTFPKLYFQGRHSWFLILDATLY